MAKEDGSKKRKASIPEQEAAKLKKPKHLTTAGPVPVVKKRKAAEDSSPVILKKSKAPKATGEFPAILPPKKQFSSLKIDGTNGPVKAKGSDNAANKVNGVKPAAATKKPTELKLPKPTDEEEDIGQLADEEGEDGEVSDVDDQTEALLKGFESDGDEEDENKDGGLQIGQAIPEIPKKSKKALKKAQLSALSDKPGVIYVGRIPHGFYENEMREYFEQFGKILKLRMSRNRKTGASRHFAFIQFESAGVADIVTRTMDGYLMFNHILKVQTIPDEQIHESLFIGANKRFKKVPWNKIRGRELNMGASEGIWDKRIEKEEKRRETKAEKAKNLFGYVFEGPKIKSAKGVAKKPVEQLALIEIDEDEIKTIEAAPAVEESSKQKKKGGKQAKSGGESAAVIKVIEAAPVDESIAQESQPKKEKKSRNAKDIDVKAPPAIIAEGSGKPKAKKEKKIKPIDSALETVNLPAVSTTHLPKKLKTKKSKSDLAEETTAGDDAGEQKKSKKNKKVKTAA